MKQRRILQIGYGAFGETHLRAWQALGLADGLVIADPRREALAAASRLAPTIDTALDYRQVLSGCDAVVIVTPSDTHHGIGGEVLDLGKPVLIEKPIVTSLSDARDLAARAGRSGALVRGGYYFRYHPKTIALRGLLQQQALGQLRFLSGKFAGIKRTRADSGALLNDAVHFLDLFMWLTGATPVSVHALTRDHFGRGLEDFALVTLEFRDGAVAHIETGYIQPGRWPDTVVPGAITSKEIAVSGSEGLVEIDYAAETMTHHAVRHIPHKGIWYPEFAGSSQMTAASAGPVEVVAAELRAFLSAIDQGHQSDRDGLDGGLVLAGVLDAALQSAATGNTIRLD